jgi:hypothetical protein
MLRNLVRLASQTTHVQQGERSIFAHLKRTSTEVVTANNPSDLESLVRIVSAIDSFKYPAFNPALQELASKDGNDEWINNIKEEIQTIPQSTALKYFKALAPAEIPSDLLLSLIKRVNIQSRNDLSDFIDGISELSASQITPDIRRATAYLINKAVYNNCKLGTYNKIFDLLNQVWRTTHRHLVPTKLRTDLVDAAWAAFLRLDMSGKDSEFADAVKWLSLGEKVTGRKAEIEEMLARVEARSKSFLQPSLIPGMISSILSYRRNVVPEPLDSIGQLLVRKLRISKLTVDELEELVNGMTRYLENRTKSPQVESLVASIHPYLVNALERNISNLPSRCMPAVLKLLVRSGDSGLVMQELERRGHEMSGPDLVRLINSMDWIEGSILVNLFSAKLGEAKYVDGLLACLTYTEKVELLASLAMSGVDLGSPDVSILTTSLRDTITNETSDDHVFEPNTIVRMVTAGDDVFSGTGLVPSKLVKAFLLSEESGTLTVANGLRLLNSKLAKEDKEIAKSLFNHIRVTGGDHLDVGEAIDLLGASLTAIKEREYIEESMKVLIPQIRSISNTHDIIGVLSLLPSELAGWSSRGSNYSPPNQFRDEILIRVSELSNKMDSKSISSCFIQLARLGFRSEEVVACLVKRGLAIAGPLVSSPEEAVEVVEASRKLRTYSPEYLDIIVRDFFKSHDAITPETLTSLGTSLTAMGNKNDTVLIAVEQLLRTKSESLDLSMKINLVNSLAKNGVFSPLFVDQLRLIFEEASKNVSALSDEAWIKLFETHLVVLVESPPKIKVRFANDTKLRNFVDENCAFSWYAEQEKQRNHFIHSEQRAQIAQAMEALGWDNMRVPELGKEVYHVDFSAEKIAIVTIPESDELNLVSNSTGVRVIVGQSMTKIKHLQLFGYKVVPIWLKEWSNLSSDEERKKCLLRNSTQVVFALGTR